MASTQPRLAGRQPAGARRLYVAELARLTDWPNALEAPDRPFIVFVAMDARETETDQLYAFAQRLLGQGAVYVCTWGPDCERVHDLFDEAAVICDVDAEVSQTAVVMTTWHDDEGLAEALEFALTDAIPDETLAPGPADVLAILVGPPEWTREVEALLDAATRP